MPISFRAQADLEMCLRGLTLVYHSQHTSGNKKAEEDASKDAEEQMKAIKDAGSKTGDKVVDDLLTVVTEVKPEIPDRIVAPAQA